MRLFKRLFVSMHGRLWRLTGGRFMGGFGGMDVLLLTTMGRKSGKSRVWPLLYTNEGADYAVVESNNGSEPIQRGISTSWRNRRWELRCEGPGSRRELESPKGKSAWCCGKAVYMAILKRKRE